MFTFLIGWGEIPTTNRSWATETQDQQLEEGTAQAFYTGVVIHSFIYLALMANISIKRAALIYDKAGVIVWGDTSPISGRILKNLSVTSFSCQADNNPGTTFTLVDTNVSPAQFIIHNLVSVFVVLR